MMSKNLEILLCDIMDYKDNGTQKGSRIYFYTPSRTAEELLYYPLCTGEFYCNEFYEVDRENYNSFFVMLVTDGEITFSVNGAEQTVHKNELLLLDCYLPHRYFAKQSAHTLWLHFDGADSRKLFYEILQQKGQCVKCPDGAAECILNIMSFRDEYEVSKSIYKMLMLIMSDKEDEHEKNRQIDEAKTFIKSHFSEPITTLSLSVAAHMSQSYFSKLFKRTTGFSPYDYLLCIRLRKAKEMLLQTDLSISEIAFKTGFNSTSNFVYFFKNQVGISPLKFRKLGF